MATSTQIDTITKHYLIALLWTMPGDDDCEHPGDAIELSALPAETIEQAKQTLSDLLTHEGHCSIRQWNATMMDTASTQTQEALKLLLGMTLRLPAMGMVWAFGIGAAKACRVYWVKL